MILGYAFTLVVYVLVVIASSWFKPVAPPAPPPEPELEMGDTDFGPASGFRLLPENERQEEQQRRTSGTTGGTGLTPSGLPMIVEPEEAAPTADRLQGRRKSRFLPSSEEALALGLCSTLSSRLRSTPLKSRATRKLYSLTPTYRVKCSFITENFLSDVQTYSLLFHTQSSSTKI